MEVEYDKSIRPILDTFDKIREILRFEKIELPKIVVVGDQSAGKSSVLESITGISLPRGENTVTKCPIVIQIRGVDRKEEESASVRIEGEDDLNLIKEEINLNDLGNKIQMKQSELLKNAKCEIADKPLYVNVKKQYAPDLTLYDLPGLTYKSDEITQNIRNIISKYTAEKQTLILLVLAANTDLTTSEAISLIRKNTDYEERTIAIITKIDLVANHEKKLLSKIMNNELNLRYNPIVVRNRTQEELEKNESSDDVKKKEGQLFNSNDQLKQLPSESKGTAQLISRLIHMQRDKLLNSKYEIKQKILDRLKELRLEESKLPLPAETKTEKLDRFKECLAMLVSNFSALINRNEVDIENLQTKTKLTNIIRENFKNFLAKFEKKQSIFFTEEFAKRVLLIINDTRGFKLPNFYDQESFHFIMKKEISSMTQDTYEVIIECTEITKDVLSELAITSFKAYPRLLKAVLIEINELMDIQVSNTKNLINELLDAEKEGEWTANLYYMDIIFKITSKIKEFKQIRNEQLNTSFNNEVVRTREPINDKRKAATNEKLIEINDCSINESLLTAKHILNSNTDEEMNVLNIQIACFAYWKVFEKRFTDYIELIILRKIVRFFKSNLGLHLERKFSNSFNHDTDIIIEDLGISQKRKEIIRSTKNLEEALKEINMIL